jgi:hypothetical protein
MTQTRVRELIAEGCRYNAEYLVETIGTKLMESLATTLFARSTGSGGRLELPRNEQPRRQQQETTLELQRRNDQPQEETYMRSVQLLLVSAKETDAF